MRDKNINLYRLLKYILAGCLLLNISGCNRQGVLYNPPSVDYPNLTVDDQETGKSIPALSANEPRPKLTLEEMESAIIEGCGKRNWIPVKVQPGVIEATLHLRTHVAVVWINYTNNRFAIKYVSSENLHYGKDEKGVEQIHPHYNSWVQNLKNDITLAIAKQARKKSKS